MCHTSKVWHIYHLSEKVNMTITKETIVGVIGSGAMGAGIAQVAATAGHSVVLYDNNATALDKAKNNLSSTFAKLEEKGKIKSAQELMGRFSFSGSLDGFGNCGLVIEAIVERLDIKKA